VLEVVTAMIPAARVLATHAEHGLRRRPRIGRRALRWAELQTIPDVMPRTEIAMGKRDAEGHPRSGLAAQDHEEAAGFKMYRTPASELTTTRWFDDSHDDLYYDAGPRLAATEERTDRFKRGGMAWHVVEQAEVNTCNDNHRRLFSIWVERVRSVRVSDLSDRT
jgi:hypothetical protein